MEIWKHFKKPRPLDKSKFPKSNKSHYVKVGSSMMKVTTIYSGTISDKDLKEAFCIVAVMKEENPPQEVIDTLKKINNNGKLVYGIFKRGMDESKYPDIRWKEKLYFDDENEIPKLMQDINNKLRVDYRL